MLITHKVIFTMLTPTKQTVLHMTDRSSTCVMQLDAFVVLGTDATVDSSATHSVFEQNKKKEISA